MKKILVLGVLLFAIGVIVIGQEWQYDLSVAKKLANEDDKHIIMVFQGSDWCAPCIKLDREVWSTDIFRNYAKEHFVMLRVDFPRKKGNTLSPEQLEKNKSLAEIYNTNGHIPLVVILDKDAKVLGQTAYKKLGPEDYITHLNSFIH